MAINLYTSRVILEALGVEDYGIYNVVGGFVAMFSVLSKALTSASTRFINFEMGKGNADRLKSVFATSLSIQWVLAIIIAILCEAVGIWFVNNKMVIAPERLFAANWVFQFSIITFCSTLITVPYNAAIIAHERMKTFAYVSIFEGLAKLGISFAVMVSPIDTLIFYAAMLGLLQLSIQAMYRIYCKRNFAECNTKLLFDRQMVREMSGYAGWTLVGTSASVIRNQGGNILINLFFGPSVNAARGVANQVLHAIHGFVTNFTMALDPQITQNYASGNYDYMMKLVYKGARLAYFMLLLLGLPIIINADQILHIWLKQVPDYAVVFTQLTIIFTMLGSLSHPLIKAQQATGKVRNYQLVVGGLNLLNIPLSYVVYKLGGSPETFIYVAIGCELICLAARLYMLRANVPISISNFMHDVVFRITLATCISVALPLLLIHIITSDNFFFLLVHCIATVFWTVMVILFVGCTKSERAIIFGKIKVIKNKILK